MHLIADITHHQPQNLHKASNWTWSKLWCLTPCPNDPLCWFTCVDSSFQARPVVLLGLLAVWDPGFPAGSYVNEGCDSYPPPKHQCGYTDMQLLLLLQEWEWAVSVHDSHQRCVYSGTWGGRLAHRCFIFIVNEFVILWNTDMQHLMCLESVAQHVERLWAVYRAECCLLLVLATPNTQIYCIILFAASPI